MMNKQIAGLVLAVSVVGGVGAGALADELTTDATSPTASATPTAPTSGTPSGSQNPNGDLTITPGAVGPVKAGMSQQEALATGYFIANAPGPVEGCPDLPLEWKKPYTQTFDVRTLGNGEITSIGIRGDGVTTAGGIGVGSTFDEVRAQYPDDALVEAGYGQSGVRIFDPQDGGWIGLLFNETVADIAGDSTVSFVEVTKGAEPDLMRDGC